MLSLYPVVGYQLDPPPPPPLLPPPKPPKPPPPPPPPKPPPHPPPNGPTPRLGGDPAAVQLRAAGAALDPDPPLFQREQNQKSVVLASLPDPAPPLLEEFHGVLADIGVGFDARHGRDDDHVAGFRLQRA